jgi:tetratricopeptide (TPR) repeat protein
MPVGADIFLGSAAEFALGATFAAIRSLGKNNTIESAYAQSAIKVIDYYEHNKIWPRTPTWNSIINLLPSTECGKCLALGGSLGDAEIRRLQHIYAQNNPPLFEILDRMTSEIVQICQDTLSGDQHTLAGILISLDALGKAIEEQRHRELVGRLDSLHDILVSSKQVQIHAIAAQVLPIWNVPHLRNRNFTGRQELLESLHSTLMSGKPAALTQAIAGLGGVGKTQMALEYAYRYRSEYDVVWWVRAEESATLGIDYTSLATQIDQLKGLDITDQKSAALLVRGWLERNQGWLLIFDNAREAGDLKEYIPRSSTGHVIITSRNPAWRHIAFVVTVETFQRWESVELLLKRTGQQDEAAAEVLAGVLGDLPLALEEAGAYIEQKGRTIQEYLQLFEKHRQELLARAKPPLEYPYTVGTTWEISFQEVEVSSPFGAKILQLMAFLAPDDIPRSLLTAVLHHQWETSESLVGDTFTIDNALEVLRHYSLVGMQGTSLSMHRLVQAVTRDRLSEEERQNLAEVAIQLLTAVFLFDEQDVTTWEACSNLLPHVLSAAGYARSLGVVPESVAKLLCIAGVYLRTNARFDEAMSVLQWALKLYETACSPDHPNVVEAVRNQGLVLQGLGDLEGAQRYVERALRIDEKAHGPEHPNVARDLNYLGSISSDLGDLDEAKRHYQRALEIYEKAGPEHPRVGTTLINLGTLLQNLGDLDGARRHYQRALEINEKAYGPEHIIMAVYLNNQGALLQNLGDLEGARRHYQRALAINEKAYGPEHPNVASNLCNLGLVLQDLGDLEGAQRYVEQALRIDEKAHGPEHPNVARDLYNLSLLLRRRGDLEGARRWIQRALEINEKTYGPEHLILVERLLHLAIVLWDLDDLNGAREAHQRALENYEKSLTGPNDIRTAGASNLLALNLLALEDLEGARKHFQRALEIYERTLGNDHTLTEGVRKHLQSFDT